MRLKLEILKLKKRMTDKDLLEISTILDEEIERRKNDDIIGENKPK